MIIFKTWLNLQQSVLTSVVLWKTLAWTANIFNMHKEACYHILSLDSLVPFDT